MIGQARFPRLSTWLYWMALVLTYALPLLVIIVPIRGYLDPPSLLARYPVLTGSAPVTATQAALVVGIGAIALIPLIAALLAVTSLLNRYRLGETLSDGSAEDILRTGRAMVALAAATVLVPTLQILVLSGNAAQRMLQIGLDDGTLGFLLSAGLLTLIGWAMREAARVKAENEGFV